MTIIVSNGYVHEDTQSSISRLVKLTLAILTCSYRVFMLSVLSCTLSSYCLRCLCFVIVLHSDET